MLRVAFALLIVIATAGLAAIFPDAQSVIVVAGGVAAVFVATLATGRGVIPRAVAVDPPPDTAEDTLIQAITEPILLVVDGRVRIANAAARALLGAHVVGEDVRLAIRHPAAAERLTPTAPDGATELVGLGGRDQRIRMQVSTLAPGRRLIHLIDRTTSFAAERARVDFVANSSHELRTPLAAIIGFIETLDDENAGADTEVRQRFLAVMMKEARRMQRLIDDLISLSRIEAEKVAAPTARVNLGIVARTVAQEARSLHGEGHSRPRADIRVDIASYFPMVPGDEALLKQLLHNLIGNALRYGRPDTPVTIRLWQESADTVGLSVADEGDGIAAEHIPRLTERFYRADSSRSRALAGTGLGLAIVKHVVEHHRGRLNIASELGVGTTVSIYLPAVIEP